MSKMFIGTIMVLAMISISWLIMVPQSGSKRGQEIVILCGGKVLIMPSATYRVVSGDTVIIHVLKDVDDYIAGTEVLLNTTRCSIVAH